MSSEVLRLKDIRRSFRQGGQTLEVLSGVNLSISRGEIVALLGPSGCGKTTLLQIAGLLENPTSGEIFINGTKVQSGADKQRTDLRRTQIGFVYQFHHLLPDFTALENLLLPQYIAGTGKKEALHR
ncbi:MAG: ATP-binding cassette domain-containing protein, partial [Alphaproteobacteria bacterium]|nr:ATP-binding cassette domain-containing protein [Alphaproteobacteria bacterium]